MHAVIFDIDGTLLHSNELDNQTYIAAIREVLGPVKLRESWTHYTNISGSGTLLEILADNGIHETEPALRAVEDAFVARIASHIDSNGPIPALPGAQQFVTRLAQSSEHRIAYATAGWFGAARLKLLASEFPLDAVPLASCNHHIAKAGIMRHALSQLATGFESVTYYGDGAWDKAAAASLGWAFVAVGEKLNGLRRFE
ncbi:MAG: HAD family hydrolase [Gammaproteobacteria bacterium]|nr:HAD family hydrolase [Gammaproteobacteria bacterium]